MKKLFLIVWILILFILAGCSVGNKSANVASPDTIPAEYSGMTDPFGGEAVSAGAEVFKSYCTACHGDQGHGDGPAGAALDPKPKNLAELQNQVGDDYLFWRINSGKAGTLMVAWQGILTEEQIWQVISFIHTLK